MEDWRFPMWQPATRSPVDWRGKAVRYVCDPITRELWRLWLPSEPLPRYLRPARAYRRW